MCISFSSDWKSVALFSTPSRFPFYYSFEWLMVLFIMIIDHQDKRLKIQRFFSVFFFSRSSSNKNVCINNMLWLCHRTIRQMSTIFVLDFVDTQSHFSHVIRWQFFILSKSRMQTCRLEASLFFHAYSQRICKNTLPAQIFNQTEEGEPFFFLLLLFLCIFAVVGN